MALRAFVAIPTNDREWQKWMRDTYDLRILRDAGSPEGRYVANRGTMYQRSDGGAGTCFYVKESGDGLATGWVAK